MRRLYLPGDGSFAAPYTLEELRTLVPADLQRWCEAANCANRMLNNPAGSCISVSCALQAFMVDRSLPTPRYRSHPDTAS